MAVTTNFDRCTSVSDWENQTQDEAGYRAALYERERFLQSQMKYAAANQLGQKIQQGIKEPQPKGNKKLLLLTN